MSLALKPENAVSYTYEEARGRPPMVYRPEVGEEICNLLAQSSESLEKILERHPHLPGKSTIYKWKFSQPDFAEKYANARRSQADNLVVECLAICEDDSQDLIQTAEGIKPNMARIARDRLKVDTIKWIACKLMPKVYGDKQQIEHSVNTHEKQLKELE